MTAPQIDHVAVELYKHADAKIESLRGDIGEMVRHDVELGVKIDHLAERVDQGVAVTGQKTLEQVMTLVNKLSEYKVQMDQQGLELGNHRKEIDRINTAVFWVATTGVLGGIVTLVIKWIHP